jgi:predicted enzyme related to lactoylglutathione lyase
MSQSFGVTRRELLLSLPGVFVARRGSAQPSTPIAVVTLNHIHLVVSNLQRSVDFYQKVFGLSVAGMQGVEADWQKPVVPMLAIGGDKGFRVSDPSTLPGANAICMAFL